MTDARAYLIAALQRVADGGDLTQDELDAAIPDPRALDRNEADACEELSHWADDDDIRVKDPAYGSRKRDRMRDHLAALTGYLPEEIERGEHKASHVPVWGCAAATFLIAVAAYLLLT